MSNLKKFSPHNIARWQVKAFLSAAALLVVIGVTIYTQILVSRLIERETKIVNTYAGIYEKVLDENADVEQILFLTQEVSQSITFPIIITDALGEPNYPFDNNSLNVEIPANYTVSEQRQYMRKLISKFSQQYPPITVVDSGRILMKFYYTHSEYIDILRFFPIIALIIVGGLIFIGYAGFKNIRKTEESMVWVGMSKEAAHQLGTPLSSLLAWVEIIKISSDDPESIYETSQEMEKDLKRLSTIANRFSKIGSKPDLNYENLLDVVENVVNYFEKRLPHIGRKVKIEYDAESLSVNLLLNAELFSWVFENLIKNAAESIDTHDGMIEIRAIRDYNQMIILVTDNGKGMSNKIRRKVFDPGFTTKKRGWGLGLSLCKRIIEQYHSGRIYVKDSALNRGTTFAIEIPINSNSED